jgi:hypothetical protein
MNVWDARTFDDVKQAGNRLLEFAVWSKKVPSADGNWGMLEVYDETG